MHQGAISAAGEDNRHSCAQDDTCALRIGQIIQLLDQHIASFKIGYDQDVGLTGDRGDDTFRTGGFWRDGVIKREWAVHDATGDLTTIRHLAQGRRFQRSGQLRIHGFDSREDCDPGNLNAQNLGQVNGVLHDVSLRLQIGVNIECR